MELVKLDISKADRGLSDNHKPNRFDESKENA